MYSPVSSARPADETRCGGDGHEYVADRCGANDLENDLHSGECFLDQVQEPWITDVLMAKTITYGLSGDQLAATLDRQAVRAQLTKSERRQNDVV